ncbi:MAG: delta-lactam-biosynthetic de-N-acetylase [Eubacteriales bacterium]|jgi:peptidoglycan-N-acetylmuramic acid deacetylase
MKKKHAITVNGGINLKKTILILTGILIAAVVTGYASKNLYFSWKSNLKTEQTSQKVSQEKVLPKTQPQNGSSQNKSSTKKPETQANGGKSEGVPASSQSGSVSDNLHGWGLKRNSSHLQPEMPSGIRQTLAQNNAYWIGSPDEKTVYLTFDEGYENGYTPGILDILKKQNVQAAFFITGHYLESQPELVKRMLQEGHIVGNHTVNHPSMPGLTNEKIKEEIEKLASDFTALTGNKMVYFRPPMGEYSEMTLAETKDLGYYTVFWSFAMADWIPLPGGPQEAYQTVMDNLHNGDLILLHAVSKDNLDSLDRTISDIKAQGYTFKTLDDLVKK